MSYETLLILLAFAGGLYSLIKGSDILIVQATIIAHFFKISPLIVGIVIISFGTSLPELAISLVISIRQQPSDLIVANVLGSNIANVLLVLGTAASLGNIQTTKEILKKHLPIGLYALFLFSIAYYGVSPYKIERLEGLVLLFSMLTYLYFTYQSQENHSTTLKSPPPDNESNSTNSSSVLNSPSLKVVFLSFLSIGMIGIGGELVSRSSLFIATEIFNANEVFAGIILLALGTSLPELVLSIIAFRRGENEILLGNILGSNIFNLLFILGVSSLIRPLNLSADYSREVVIHGISILAIFVFSSIGKPYTLSRVHGIVFLLLYMLYLYYFLVENLNF